MKYFSHDAWGDLEFHETAAAAREAAQEALESERDAAGDGWSEEVTNICWGELRERVTERSRRPVDRGPDSSDPTGVDFIADYALERVEIDPPKRITQAEEERRELYGKRGGGA